MELTAGRMARPLLNPGRSLEAQRRRGMTEAHLPDAPPAPLCLSPLPHAQSGFTSTHARHLSHGTAQAELRSLSTKCGALSSECLHRHLPSSSLVRGSATRPSERGSGISCSMEHTNVSAGKEEEPRVSGGGSSAATALPELDRGFPSGPQAAGSPPVGPASLVGGRPTGGTMGFKGATEALLSRPLTAEKHIVLMRHGLSSWNEEGRVQGSSEGSILSSQGELQALRCRDALRFIPFDCCFASPLERAKMSAEIVWKGRDGPLVYLDCLREANLLFLEGMLNSEARVKYPEEFRAWREDPANFQVDGVYPVRRLWDQAKEAWTEILSQQGNTTLVVTHKSLLRALVCTALGMGPERFRAMDVNNGGICVMKVGKSGEPIVESLNLTSHLQCEAVHYNL